MTSEERRQAHTDVHTHTLLNSVVFPTRFDQLISNLFFKEKKNEEGEVKTNKKANSLEVCPQV